jgi:LacI family transcriptional regulator
MISTSPYTVLLILELTEAYAQAILRGACRRGGHDPRFRLHTTRLYPLENLPPRLANCDAIIASLIDQEVADTLLKKKVPIVNVSNRGTAFHPVSVVSDLAGALDRGLRHFQERGLTRIATLGKVADLNEIPEDLSSRFQYQGRVPFDMRIRVIDQKLVAQTGAWLKQAGFPLAVFCGSDAQALQLSEICERNGISVPQEVAILGSGNDEVACFSAHPTLSSVDMRFEEVGAQALGLLLNLLEGRNPKPNLRSVSPGQVMIRQSSNIYAVDDPYVAKALRIMDEDLTTHLNIGTLAETLNISRRMFEHRFHRKMNMAPAAYLRAKRLRRAKELLKNSDMQITEIAYAAGFANAAHFCTLFRKQQGMSPNQYRASL